MHALRTKYSSPAANSVCVYACAYAYVCIHACMYVCTHIIYVNIHTSRWNGRGGRERMCVFIWQLVTADTVVCVNNHCRGSIRLTEVYRHLPVLSFVFYKYLPKFLVICWRVIDDSYYIYPPHNVIVGVGGWGGGGGWWGFIGFTLSVHLSVRPSVSLSLHLSVDRYVSAFVTSTILTAFLEWK